MGVLERLTGRKHSETYLKVAKISELSKQVATLDVRIGAHRAGDTGDMA